MKFYRHMRRSEKAIEERLRKELQINYADNETVEYYEDIILQLKKEIEELKKNVQLNPAQQSLPNYTPAYGNYNITTWTSSNSISIADLHTSGNYGRRG
jgi:hypothetical protein